MKLRLVIFCIPIDFSWIQCENEPQDVPFPGVCPEVNRKCVEWFAADDYPTNMSRKYCDEWVPCSNCESVQILIISYCTFLFIPLYV